jgi:hypothetical protein
MADKTNIIKKSHRAYGYLSVVSVVLPGRGLCDDLATRPEESYRLWCVVFDLEKQTS